MKNRLIALVETAAAKKEVPGFEIGDTVDVHQRILEGEKERIQIFNGTVIARKGEGARETFTVRRIVQGEGVERVFPIHSPKIARIEVKKTGRVRRAKLYYLRGRVYCGYSTSPGSLWDSSATLAASPSTPGTYRTTVSITTIAGTSPPLQTKSPTDTSRGRKPRRMRSSKPS